MPERHSGAGTGWPAADVVSGRQTEPYWKEAMPASDLYSMLIGRGLQDAEGQPVPKP